MKRKKRKILFGLTMIQQEDAKRRLRMTTCSEYWVEAQFERIDLGDRAAYILDESRYPPPADTPSCEMRTCPRCGVTVPAPYMGSRVCVDCECAATIGREQWASEHGLQLYPSSWLAQVMERVRLYGHSKKT